MKKLIFIFLLFALPAFSQPITHPLSTAGGGMGVSKADTTAMLAWIASHIGGGSGSSLWVPGTGGASKVDSSGANLNNVASGSFSMAEGQASAAIGDGSVAMGWDDDYPDSSLGNGSFTMGTGNKAVSNYAVAIGEDNRAIGVASFSIGLLDTAGGDYSVAMGRNTVASGQGSFAMGDGDYSPAIASGQDATVFGTGGTASGGSSFIGGGAGNYAGGPFAATLGGAFDSLSGTLSTAFGIRANDLGYPGSFLVGLDTTGTTVTSPTAFGQMVVRAPGGAIFYDDLSATPALSVKQPITDTFGRVITGGTGGQYSVADISGFVTQFGAISGTATLYANAIAFSATADVPMQTAVLNGTIINITSGGVGANPIQIEIAFTGLIHSAPMFSTMYNNDAYDVIGTQTLQWSGMISGNPAMGILINTSNNPTFTLCDVNGTPITTALQSGDQINISGSLNLTGD